MCHTLEWNPFSVFPVVSCVATQVHWRSLSIAGGFVVRVIHGIVFFGQFRVNLRRGDRVSNCALSSLFSVPFSVLISEDDVFSYATNLLGGIDRHLHSVSDLLARLPHTLRDVGRRECVWIDVDVESLVLVLDLRTPGLVDDAQVERVHAEAGQAASQFVHVQLIQSPGAGQQRSTSSMGESDFLATEDSSVGRVIRGKDRVRGIAGHAQREPNAQLGGHIGIGNAQPARVAVFMLQRRQSQNKVLRQLLNGVLSGLLATGHIVHDTCGGGRGLLNGVPDAEELQQKKTVVYQNIRNCSNRSAKGNM